jgi:hypothetical protein
MPILGILASSFRSAAGPVGAYDSLATVTLSSSTASVNFAGIPSGYKHLQVRILGRCTGAYTGNSNIIAYFNGDTTNANYYSHQLNGSGSSAVSTANANSYLFGRVPDNNMLSNAFGSVIVDILDYGNSNKYKVTRGLTGVDVNGSGGEIMFTSVLWKNTNAITSITLNLEDGNWLTNSSIALYGVK